MIGPPPLPMERRRASKAQESLGDTMTGRRMALVATAAMAVATPAAAQVPMTTETYFQHVDRFCLAGGGDPALAIAAAEAEGWIAAPQAMIDEILNPNAPEAAVRLSGPADAAPARLILTSSPPMAGHDGVKVRVCMVEPAPASAIDEAALTALVETRLGLAAAILPVWAFSGTGPYTDQTELMLGGMEAMAAHAATEPVYMLNLMPTDDGTPALGLLRLGE